jgi:hypothetical protein
MQVRNEINDSIDGWISSIPSGVISKNDVMKKLKNELLCCKQLRNFNELYRLLDKTKFKVFKAKNKQGQETEWISFVDKRIVAENPKDNSQEDDFYIEAGYLYN